MSDSNDYCARCGRLSTCKRSCNYITDFNGYHIPDYHISDYHGGYDSDSSDEELTDEELTDEELTYLEELLEYLMSMQSSK